MANVRKCLLCSKDVKYIARHLKNQHNNMSKKEYYDRFLRSEGDGVCICKSSTRWDDANMNYHQFCTASCRATTLFTGRVKSQITVEKTKKSLREFYKTDAGTKYKNIISERQVGEKNTVHRQSKETRDRMSKNNSEKMKLKILRGEFTPPVTNSWCRSKCTIPDSDIKFRSTWEAIFYILNKENVEYEKLRIPYISEDGDSKTYIVDFIDKVNSIVYEVKPKKCKNKIRNILKDDALNKWSKDNNYTYITIDDEYFLRNAKDVDYSNLCDKIKRGMKQFL